jgi:hypothetical protein
MPGGIVTDVEREEKTRITSWSDFPQPWKLKCIFVEFERLSSSPRIPLENAPTLSKDAVRQPGFGP